jgi:hypothetical protein
MSQMTLGMLPRPPLVPPRKLWLDTAVVLAATVAAIAPSLGWNEPAVRVPTGLILSLFAPGYALVMALFPTPSLPNAERIALSVPASLIVGVLVGTVANEAPSGLTQLPIVLLPWATTLVLLMLAYGRLVVGQPSAETSRSRPAAPVRFGPGTLIGGALIAAAGTFAVYSIVAASFTHPKPFTALSVDGASGTQHGAEPLTVTVDNQEGVPMVYDLEVVVDDEVVSRTEAIRLEPGTHYSMALPSLQPGDGLADVLAYRSGEPEIYRSVRVSAAPDGS